jgi:hypothetical protein
MTDQTTNRRRTMGKLARTIGALALAAGVTLGATGEAAAADLGASLNCQVGSGEYTLNLPYTYYGYYSLFYVSVDGSDWQTTNWFWSGSYLNYELGAAGWEYRSLGVSSALGNGHTVSAWEYRYFSNGATEWVNLGSCTTSSFDFGGLIFTYN